MDDSEKPQIPSIWRTVTGYDGSGQVTMAEYLPKELARLRAQKVEQVKVYGVDLAQLRKERREREKRIARGEMEGPPNPFKPHRKL